MLQVIRQVLDDSRFQTLADDGEVATPETAEHVLYARLRDDGWIMEVANRKVTEVYMPREAHALLSSLITLREELKVDI
ncbi:Wadjet anti-phage system protein JetA family protein, partial [Escherichia fergusonii]|uniref:Wadjet anti-phage system protein JetA family protein n=1 Tax=Escherichia fergusonii TaxID=564 RepID=UPI0015D6C9F8